MRYTAGVPERLGIKLRSRGRGADYTLTRGLIETVLDLAFRGEWPARLWARVPGSTEVRLIERELPLLEPGTPPLRLGFISDIHLGPTTPIEVVDRGFELLRRAAPDVLLLGGDYVFLRATSQKAELLGDLVASVPAPTKLAVFGNHDLWDHHDVLRRALEHRGARVLVNEVVRLPGPHDGVVIVGLDDPWTGTRDPDAAFADIGEADTRIVLAHAPEVMPWLRGREVALTLCGHTHGGHISLPHRPIYIHGAIGKHHWAGFHQFDDTTLFVSRGIGGIELPIRWNAQPDVALLTLTS